MPDDDIFTTAFALVIPFIPNLESTPVATTFTSTYIRLVLSSWPDTLCTPA